MAGCGTPSLDSALILRRELGDEGDPGPEQALPDGRMWLRAASGGRESRARGVKEWRLQC